MQDIRSTDMRENKDIRYYTKYANDPKTFIEKYLEIKLLKWQLEIIDGPVKEFVNNYDENYTKPIAIAGANTTGKSYFGKCLMVWHFCCIENSRSFILTNSERQTKGVNYEEVKDMLFKLFHSSVIKIQDVIHFSGDEEATSDKWSIEYQRTSRVKSSNTGHHKPRMFFFFDEATEFKDSDWDSLTTKMMSKRVLVYCCGNPHSLEAQTGFERIFEQSLIKHDGINWYTRNINLLEDVPPTMYNPDVIKSIVAINGKDSDKYRCMVLGQFPKSTSRSRFPIEIIRKAMQPGVSTNYYGIRVMGIDISENSHNGSSSAIAIRNGPYLSFLKSYKESYEDFTEKQLMHEIFNRDPNVIVIDSNGTGTGLYYKLASEFGKTKKVIGVKFQESAADIEQYSNRKSELYWKASEWLRKDVNMIMDSMFARALSMIKFETSSGRIATESKYEFKRRLDKELVFEIDKIDAFCLTFATNEDRISNNNLNKKGVYKYA